MSASRVLVVRLGAMGDILHTLPAVASLKQSFPQSHISWVVEPKWTALLQGNPFVDEIISVDRRSLRSILALRRKLRRQPCEFAVDFQGLIKSAVAAAFARPERIYGFDRSAVREKPACLFYSRMIKPLSAHIVDRNLELAAGAGACNIVRSFWIPAGHPEGNLPEGDFVLANPAAGWPGKQWPLEHYAKLGAMLEAECGLPLVLNGAQKIDVAGTYSHISGLPGLIDATRRAVAVVGVDSGPMHLAASLGKPGVAIFGPTDPARNGPYGTTIAVLRSPRAQTTYERSPKVDESMRAIGAEEVFAALKAKVVQGVRR